MSSADDLNTRFLNAVNTFNGWDDVSGFLDDNVTIYSVRKNYHVTGKTNALSWLGVQYSDQPNFNPGTRDQEYTVNVTNTTGSVHSKPGTPATWTDIYGTERVSFAFKYVLINGAWLLLSLVAKP